MWGFATLLMISIFAGVFVIKHVNRDPIGDMQMTVFDTYNEGEKTLFYLDQSSKYAFKKVEPMLNCDKDSCEVSKAQVEKKFNEELNGYISDRTISELYGEYSLDEGAVPLNNYRLEFRSGKVFAKAIKDIKIVNSNVEYSVTPNLVIETDVDFNKIIWTDEGLGLFESPETEKKGLFE